MQGLKALPVELVVPPVGDCTMPMLGPHTIASYLRSKGILCRVHDVGLDLLRLAASPSIIKDKATGGIDDPCLAALIQKGMVVQSKAKDSMSSLVIGLKLFSLQHYPLRLSIDDVALDSRSNSISDVRHTVDALSGLRPLLAQTCFFSNLAMFRNSLIGVSVSFPSQIAIAIIICKMLKQNNPSLKIAMGGSYFYSCNLDISDMLTTFDCIDVVIEGPGELILESLALRSDAFPLATRVAVIKDRWAGRTFDSPHSSLMITDIDWLSYGASHRTIPYHLKTSCYYGRCRFCSGDKLPYSASIHEASDRLDNLNSLISTQGVQCVYFVDEALSIDLLGLIAKSIGGKAQWAANARLDTGMCHEESLRTLRENGCWMLRFGFESGSQRVLDAMNKGTHIAMMSRIIDLAHKLDIKIHLYILLGYPEEDADDRNHTIDFLQKHKGSIYSYSISIFQAIPGTDIYDSLCAELCLDKDDYTNAMAAINEYLYPTEDDYDEIQRCISRIGTLLANTSRSNKFCYSARVFDSQSHETNISKSMRLMPLTIEYGYEDPRQWSQYFTNVIDISRGDSKRNKRTTFIDLVNDIVVSCEINEKGIVPHNIFESVRTYLIDRDIERLNIDLPHPFTALKVTSSPNCGMALQYNPLTSG